MRFKTLCLIVLLVSVSVVSAELDVFDSETDDVGLKSDNITDNLIQKSAVECSSDSDCHHLGKCETSGGGNKLCNCKSGTSGDLCERVDECVDNPVKCGTRGDVSCVFDVVLEKAVCECDNVSKTYVVDEERCMSPCTRYDQCGQYGYCYHEIGNLTFCACDLGTSGDYCEIVDECHNNHVDCGLEPDATCTLGGQGRAYCKCSGTNKGFDYDEKVCKDCSGCGENALKTGCAYRNGIRRCICKLRFYSSEKGICEDCKCGAHGYGCDFKNGTKMCKCFSGYQPKGDVCEKCDCGSEGTNCEFKDGEKVCTCREGYIQSGRDGICTQMCNATNPCENGGKCVREVCDCPKGTSGPLCETIDDCRGRLKCGEADCLYNVTSRESYCKCGNSKLVFDDVWKTCRVCDCGKYQEVGCSYVQGKKKCRCMDSYADRMGECTLCSCKGHSSIYGCHFEGSKMVCVCNKGYVQQGDECKECDCGDHGKCIFYGRTLKYCTCDRGYVVNGETCSECNCGSNGGCHYVNGEKECICNKGYKGYRGTCRDCDCGPDYDCQFDYFGQKECKCKPGYGIKNGKCTECNCYPGTSCVFDNNPYSNGRKDCICPAGYVNSGGKCEDCDCGLKEANCTQFVFTKCICPKGYEEKPKYFNFGSTCKDINECLQTSACPYSTDCVNTPGSYECVCKAGYEEKLKYNNYDIKVDGCQDIDECARDWSPCNDPRAKCVNTPGSYRCDCNEGYYSSKGSSEKYTICYPESRPWRTATIVVGCLSAVIVIGLLIGICSKHMSLDDC